MSLSRVLSASHSPRMCQPRMIPAHWPISPVSSMHEKVISLIREQQMRFLVRIRDPLKQWKLSPMDLQSRARWEAYTLAKEEMFLRTNIPEAPWFIVEGNDKKRARLNCIDHLLQQILYKEVPHGEITLPQRVFDPHYERKVLPS